MKKNYLKSSLFLSLFLASSCVLVAQNAKQRSEITKNYNLEKLQALQQSFSKQEALDKKKAYRLAKLNNWPIKKIELDGSFSELQGVSPNGKPIYYTLDNVAAARSTRANHLNSGGSLGLSLDGQGMLAGVWDGGPTRPTHQEYTGRIVIGDGNTTLDGNSFHACHVTGTVAGAGIVANAKGMATVADVRTFDWNDDEAETIAEAANGLLLSNHSYGVPLSADNTLAGKYIQDSRNWDIIAYNAPYYLQVMSAGNDGNNNNSVPSTPGFDKLMYNKTAKNNLVIANAQDANVAANGDLISVAINIGSSEGPTDDFRIKPDIAGNGTGLYSSWDTSDTAYNSISGTSMSAPNVTGTLLLVQQHFNNVNSRFMKAATLKGLATHTADDAGNPGPDAFFGWGLLNAKAAVEAIDGDGFTSIIEENSLAQGETYTFDVISDGSTPLLASITWTDVPGAVNTGGTNDTTPALVNDLDIRITGPSAGVFYPWRLTSNANQNATRNSDNDVDNVERINIDNPVAGTYTITITHKGTLQDGPQDYSLIVTGTDSAFALQSSNLEQTTCSNQALVFNFNYEQIGGGTTNLSYANAPAGVNVALSQNSVNSNTSFTVNVTNLSVLAAGDYAIDIIGDNGTETETKVLKFKVYTPTITPATLMSPSNGSYDGAITNTFTWSQDVNVSNYDFELSTDPSFATTVFSANVTDSQVQVSNLSEQTVYYWRVRGNNICNNGNYSEVFTFQVGTEDCSNVYSTNTPVAINNTVDNSGNPPYGAGWSRSIINVADNINITDVYVNVDITHTYLGDLDVYVESPVTYNQLLAQSCGGNDNIDAIFSDAGVALACGTNPAVSGNVLPIGGFVDAYSGTASQGEWSLTTQDAFNGDNGFINGWTLTICSVEAITNVPNFVNNGFNVDLNSTYTAVIGDIEATSSSESAAQQTYTLLELPTIGNLRLNGVDLVIGDTFTQDDVNTSKITYVNTESSDYTDEFKVNIANAASGWLANQIVPINAANLNISDFELGQLAIWPNPTKGQLNVQLNNAGSSKVTISLYDLQGRTVFAKQFDNNNTVFDASLDLSRFANGAYIVKIENGNKKATKQLIINN